MSQPNPKPNNSQPIHEQVIEDMKRRAELGKASYGTYLQVNNGRDPLLDAYEEAMDMALYLKQAILERPAVNRERMLGAIEALEKISSNPGFPTLAANLVELWIKWTHEAISALPPEPEQSWTPEFEDADVQTVYRLLCDSAVPPSGDHWEGFAAQRIVAALRKPQPWTPRERRLRKAAKVVLVLVTGGYHVPHEVLGELSAALADTPPPDPASVESTLAAVARDDAERTIERMHGPAKPDPRDEALERAKGGR